MLKPHHILFSLIAAVAATVAPAAHAFPTDTYTATSALATGHWIKVAVTQTGMHFIPRATLQAWGFADHTKVRIHGYGGQRQTDILSTSTYIDDLPQQQTLITAQGIYFYAQGPVTWAKQTTGYYLPSQNPFSNTGHYFITADTDGTSTQRQVPVAPVMTSASTPSTEFQDYLVHEIDRNSPSETGYLLTGEDFRNKPTQSFDFELISNVASRDVWIHSAFVSNASAATQLVLSANSTKLSTTTVTPLTDSYGVRTVQTGKIKVTDRKLSVQLTYNPSGVVGIAALDLIAVNFTRQMVQRYGKLDFRSSRATMALSSATTATHVWDVTDPLAIVAMPLVDHAAGMVRWVTPYTGERQYTSFNEGVDMPTPTLVGTVSNQDLHGLTTTPDMVIITLPDWAAQAQRLAQMHRTHPQHPIDVEVVNADLIYNEFSSGTPDVGALRRYLKMVYDRGQAAGHTLRYALLMGRATHDYRNITQAFATLHEPAFPTWQTEESLRTTVSFTSDDPIAILGDDTGYNLANDTLSIALGRAPVHTLTQATQWVDKQIAYTNARPDTEWPNQVVLMSDNGDDGIFIEDTEAQYENLLQSPDGPDMFYTKVYIDAFPVNGGTCDGARTRLHRMLDDGTMWFTYVGHGDPVTLCEEKVFTNSDINNMYNRRWPVLFAATCSFARHDRASGCGAEILALNPSGGTIASIAPTREAYISDNGRVARSIGKHAFTRHSDGTLLSIGEIYRRAKNQTLADYPNTGDQRMRYVFLGDPAMHLVLPQASARLEQINGQDIRPDSDEPVTIMARQNVTLTGALYNPDGTLMHDFDGTISATLYDAEYSTTSNGAYTGGAKPTYGKKVTFQEQGSKLYSGRGTVTQGRFTLQVPMPSEVAHNFRPAALNMYAYSPDGRNASGCNRQFYVYGFDETADPDTQAPVIETCYLNNPAFTNGQTVNATPMLMAHVTDDTGINLSSAGVGHQMTIKIDDRHTINDVAMYYTPTADGSVGGDIAYPLDDLSDGAHTLTLRVWDTSGNSASRQLDFYVRHDEQPRLFDIFTDANPATTEANFYVTHNRPDARLTVALDIYDLSGHRLWTTTVTDRSDLFNSAPIHWNLTDLSGRRVPRGIYIYRATVTTDGHTLQSVAKRIAVTSK